MKTLTPVDHFAPAGFGKFRQPNSYVSHFAPPGALKVRSYIDHFPPGSWKPS